MKIEQIKEEIADMVDNLECGECDYNSRCDGHVECMSAVLASILIDMTEEDD